MAKLLTAIPSSARLCLAPTCLQVRHAATRKRPIVFMSYKALEIQEAIASEFHLQRKMLKAGGTSGKAEPGFTIRDVSAVAAILGLGLNSDDDQVNVLQISLDDADPRRLAVPQAAGNEPDRATTSRAWKEWNAEKLGALATSGTGQFMNIKVISPLFHGVPKAKRKDLVFNAISHLIDRYSVDIRCEAIVNKDDSGNTSSTTAAKS